jgi:hypothetical protein
LHHTRELIRSRERKRRATTAAAPPPARWREALRAAAPGQMA